MPDIGEDPIRVLARLPGVAGQDFSSRVHLRGGTEDETLVRFDDLRLYNPYHLKDFFGVFSSIDPAIVSDVRVYTGGFPAAFGDRSSGVVDIAPRLASKSIQGEAVASFFSAGASVEGSTSDGAGDWALAARRGNMDVFFDLVDSPLGEPEYHDLYARAGRRLNDWFAISANALAFDDKILAFDSDQEEEAIAEYRDQYYWLRMDIGAPDGLGGRVLAAHTVLESERAGTCRPAGSRQRHARRREAFHDRFDPGGWLVEAGRTLAAAGRRGMARAERPLRLRRRSGIRAPFPDAGRGDRTLAHALDQPAAVRTSIRRLRELAIRADRLDRDGSRPALGSRDPVRTRIRRSGARARC